MPTKFELFLFSTFLTLIFTCNANVDAIEVDAKKENSEQVRSKPEAPAKKAPIAKEHTKEDTDDEEKDDEAKNDKPATNNNIKVEVPSDVPLELLITVNGLDLIQGQLCLLIFDRADGFPSALESAIHYECLPVTAEFNAIPVTLKPSKNPVAISIFHDQNSNDELDVMGALGIPTEPYGFSRNPGITIGAPTFEQTALTLVPGTNEITIDLLRIL